MNTVSGITSRVDIIWSLNGAELERIEGVNVNYTTKNSTVYTHPYSLNSIKAGGVLQCKAIINIDPPVKATGSVITLYQDVAGMYMYTCTIIIYIHYIN